MKKTAKNISVGLVSLGCAKNAVDLQVMAGTLRKAGFTLAPSPDDCDAVIVNTCGFIRSACEEAVAEIGRACELKRAGRVRAVVAAGCFVQRYREDLRGLFPEVDAFAGIDAVSGIAGIVRGALAHSAAGRSAAVPCSFGKGLPSGLFNPPEPALRFTGRAFAYLKIAEGCAHRCAYCAIPSIRGNCRSRRMADILREARTLVATGVKELDIIAQDPLLWGRDLDRGRRGITDLLRALDGIEGDFRTRLLYAYPSEVTDPLLEWMAESPRALKYLDVPVQHTVPEVLKAMNRGAAVEATLGIAERARAAVPGVTLRTTVMTGFPGETEKRFARMLEDLERMDFDYLGVFAFSPEEGTPAAAMKNRPPRKAAEERAAAIEAMQSRAWKKKARAMKGAVKDALVVAPGIARLESQAPDVDGATEFSGGSPAVGETVRVRITGNRGYDFLAEIAK